MSQKPDNRRLTGQLGEDIAANHLAQQGYFIVERNWRCRSGELDIIADKDGQLLVVEVRTRNSGGLYGHPAESVQWRKQAQVRKTAQIYLLMTGQSERIIRFDVITVILKRDALFMDIDHIPNAF